MNKHVSVVILLALSIQVFSACLNTNKQPKQVSFTVTIFKEGEGFLQEIFLEGSTQHILENVTCVSRSPDNQHIAYSEAGDIYVRDLSSGEKQTFEIDFWSLSHPVWSPAGDKLAFAGKDREEMSRNVWLLDVKTNELEKISNCKGNAGECFISAPGWSNHNRLMYGERIGGTTSIIEYDTIANNISASYPLDTSVGGGFAFGNAERSVENINFTTPSLAWSPDGVHIAIVNNDLPSNVLLLNVQTQEVVDVTNSSTLSVGFDSPVWSSDGQWLILRKLRMIQYDFWEIVGYDIVLVDVANGLSDGEFQFNVIYESNDPLICPGNLVVAE